MWKSQLEIQIGTCQAIWNPDGKWLGSNWKNKSGAHDLWDGDKLLEVISVEIVSKSWDLIILPRNKHKVVLIMGHGLKAIMAHANGGV